MLESHRFDRGAVATITRKASLALTGNLILLILLLGSVAVILLVYELRHYVICQPIHPLLLNLGIVECLSSDAIRLHLPLHLILRWRISLRVVLLLLHRIYYLL